MDKVEFPPNMSCVAKAGAVSLASRYCAVCVSASHMVMKKPPPIPMLQMYGIVASDTRIQIDIGYIYLCRHATPSHSNAAIAASTADPFLANISVPICAHS